MGFLTLLSDLGLQDASVAVAKGILMRYPHGRDIMDITHHITPFHTRQAAYLLGAAYHSFPQGTCHIVLFDLFSEPEPALILCEHEGHYFLAPDNGIIPLALGALPAKAWQCTSLKKDGHFTDWLHAMGLTVNSLQSGNNAVTQLPARVLKQTPELSNIAADGTLSCEVIHIDQYENVVTSITRQQFDALGHGRPFRLQFMRVEEISELSDGYAAARAGYKLCRFNSSGHLEICINRGRAASLFGLRLGSKNNDIKLIFE